MVRDEDHVARPLRTNQWAHDFSYLGRLNPLLESVGAHSVADHVVPDTVSRRASLRSLSSIPSSGKHTGVNISLVYSSL